MKKVILCILITILGFVSCSTSNVDNSPEQVVIIVDGTLHSTFYYTSEKRYGGPMFRIDGKPILSFRASDSKEKIGEIDITRDTMIIPLHSDHLYVRYRFNAVSNSDFVAQRGLPSILTIEGGRSTALDRTMEQPLSRQQLRCFQLVLFCGIDFRDILTAVHLLLSTTLYALSAK